MPRHPRRTDTARAASAIPVLSRLGRPGVHLLTFVLLALALWSLIGFIGQVITSAQMERRKEELRAENAQLKARAEALRNDPAAIEVVARETLGLARPDELVVTRPK